MRKKPELEELLSSLKWKDDDLKFEKKAAAVDQGVYSTGDAADHKEIKRLMRLIKTTLKSEDSSNDDAVYTEVRNHPILKDDFDDIEEVEQMISMSKRRRI